MALRQETVRLLIADDVGIGKTIEAGLIAAELLALGDARAAHASCAALHWPSSGGANCARSSAWRPSSCCPARYDGWNVTCTGSESIFDRHPITVVSTDFIKSERRRYEFLRTCPDLVIVDEAHTCVADGGPGGKARTQRYDLVRDARRRQQPAPRPGHGDPAQRQGGGLPQPARPARPRPGDHRPRAGDGPRTAGQALRPASPSRHPASTSTRRPRSRRTGRPRRSPTRCRKEYKALFEAVLDYARGSVRTEGTAVQKRVSLLVGARAAARARLLAPCRSPDARHPLGAGGVRGGGRRHRTRCGARPCR